MNLFEQTLLGNTIRGWLLALLATLFILGALWLLKHIVLKRITAFAEKDPSHLGDLFIQVLARTNFFLMAVLAVYAGLQMLQLSDVVRLWIGRVALLAFFFQLAIWSDSLIVQSILRYQKTQMARGAARVTTLRVVSFVVRLVLFTIIILLALDNMGVKITSLVASLGIGSIAVALAAQNILVDLFASLAIALDQPFAIGDFIIAGDAMGTVENVGLKTTRIRSVTGEQLVFSNSKLLQDCIHNYKTLKEQMVVFTFGVAYETPAEKLGKIPDMVKEIAESQSPIRFDRVHFKSFSESALTFEVLYHVLSPDYTLHMNIQQAINLQLVKRFQQEGIRFAYPTRVLYMAEGNLPLENGG